MWIFYSAVAVSAAMLIGCSLRQGEYGETGAMHVAHRSGFAIVLPESLAVEEMDAGFIITPPKPADSGRPSAVTIRLRRGAWPIEPDLAEARSVQGKRVYFAIDDEPGASGGRHHRFRAWIPCDRGYLEISQIEQDAWPGIPEFELSWTVIAGVISIAASE